MYSKHGVALKKLLLIVLFYSLNSFASIVYWELSEQPYQCTNGKSYDVLTEVVSYSGNNGSWGVRSFCEKGIINRTDGIFREDENEIQLCSEDESTETSSCFQEFKSLNPELRGHINKPLNIVHGDKLVSFCKVDLIEEYWEIKTSNDKLYDHYYLNYYVHKSRKKYKVNAQLIMKEGGLTRLYDISNTSVKIKRKRSSVLLKRRKSLRASIDISNKESTEIYSETDDRVSLNGNNYSAVFDGNYNIQEIINTGGSTIPNLNHLQGTCLVYKDLQIKM